MQTIKEQLETIVTKLDPVINRFNCKKVDESFTSISASMDYVADNLYLRLSVDRRLSEIKIGSVYYVDHLRCLSFFKEMLDPPAHGQWNLSIEQQCMFLVDQWDYLNNVLDKDNVMATIHTMDEYKRKALQGQIVHSHD